MSEKPCPKCGGPRVQRWKKGAKSGLRCTPCVTAKAAAKRQSKGVREREAAAERERYSINQEAVLARRRELYHTAKEQRESVFTVDPRNSGLMTGDIPHPSDLDCWGDWDLETTEIA